MRCASSSSDRASSSSPVRTATTPRPLIHGDQPVQDPGSLGELCVWPGALTASRDEPRSGPTAAASSHRSRRRTRPRRNERHPQPMLGSHCAARSPPCRGALGSCGGECAAHASQGSPSGRHQAVGARVFYFWAASTASHSACGVRSIWSRVGHAPHGEPARREPLEGCES
jgi:hypothetical protein